MSQTVNDLRPAHVDVKPENNAKIIAGAIVALMLIGAGAYGYEAGMFKGAPRYAVSDSQLPQPSLPVAPHS
jgi:hypothetical protein